MLNYVKRLLMLTPVVISMGVTTLVVIALLMNAHTPRMRAVTHTVVVVYSDSDHPRKMTKEYVYLKKEVHYVRQNVWKERCLPQE